MLNLEYKQNIVIYNEILVLLRLLYWYLYQHDIVNNIEWDIFILEGINLSQYTYAWSNDTLHKIVCQKSIY